MRSRLRTLLIVLAFGPPVLAGLWWVGGKWREGREKGARLAAIQRLNVDGGGGIRVQRAQPVPATDHDP